jgi:hypothetical protein
MCSGAMLTMTDMSKESFCAVQNMDKSGIQWQVSHPHHYTTRVSIM